MKRLLAKLPRSSSGSRDASASSSASRCPFDILDVSITEAAAGFCDFALVSSATCFSGASSGDFISNSARNLILSFRTKLRNLSIFSGRSMRCLDSARHDKLALRAASSSCSYLAGQRSAEPSEELVGSTESRPTDLHKISFRFAHAFSKVRMAKTSHRSARAGPFHRQFSSHRNGRQTEAARLETARSRFPKSFRNRRLPAPRPLFLQ